MARVAKLDFGKIDRKKLDELIQRRSQVLLLSPSDIHPNPYNKNKMGARQFAALKANMANPKVGFTTPIQVRPHPELSGQYMIVDGEHRWKSSKDIGLERIPAVNLEEMPEALAKYLMIEANAVHGVTSDEDKKAVLQEVEEDPEFQTLFEDLDIWAASLTDEAVDDTDKYKDLDEDLEETQDTQLVSLYLTPPQMERYRRIIGQIRLSSGVTAELALMQVIEHFEDTTGMGVATGDETLDEKQSDLIDND